MARSQLIDTEWPTEQRDFDIPLTIGVISDTHIYAHGARQLPAQICDLFTRFSVGLILHAGDVNVRSVFDALALVAPVIAVTGNNDDIELRARLDPAVRFTVGRFRFALVHGHGGRSARSEARRFTAEADCVVYGHSHIPLIEDVDGTILFNPGSATDRRWQEYFGVGLIRVSKEKIEPELVLFDDPRHLKNVRP